MGVLSRGADAVGKRTRGLVDQSQHGPGLVGVLGVVGEDGGTWMMLRQSANVLGYTEFSAGGARCKKAGGTEPR